MCLKITGFKPYNESNMIIVPFAKIRYKVFVFKREGKKVRYFSLFRDWIEWIDNKFSDEGVNVGDGTLFEDGKQFERQERGLHVFVTRKDARTLKKCLQTNYSLTTYKNIVVKKVLVSDFICAGTLSNVSQGANGLRGECWRKAEILND